MTSRTNLVKSSLLALGMGAALAAPTAGNAQSIIFAGGGSSALLGNFTTGSFFPGGVPTLAITLPQDVANFNPNGSMDTFGGFQTNLTVEYDPATAWVEPVANSDTLVLYSLSQADASSSYVGRARILILVRSDSGQGVRYAFNAERLGLFGAASMYPLSLNGATQTVTATTIAGTPPVTVSAATVTFVGATPVTSGGVLTPNTMGSIPQRILAALVSSTVAVAAITFSTTTIATSGYTCNIPLNGGFADVSADTIIAYASIAESVSPPRGFALPLTGPGSIRYATFSGDTYTGPIQTLLPLYNTNLGLGHILNVTRTSMKNIIAGAPGDANGDPLTWSQIDPSGPAHAIDAYFREETSGTRQTELLDVQRFAPAPKGDEGTVVLQENNLGFYNSNGTALPTSTGSMVNAVNGDTYGFGYGFITGTAGNSKGSIRVATFDGVAAIALRDSGGTISLPSYSAATANNGQPAYSTVSSSSYYTNVANGTYELWAISRAYSSGGDGSNTISTLLSLVNDANNATIVHQLGFTQVNELQATRVAKPSVYVTGDAVTDGQLITFDLTSGPSSANTPFSFNNVSGFYGAPSVTVQ